MKDNMIIPRGIIVSPYRKPNFLERMLMKIRRLFEIPRKMKHKVNLNGE